MNLSEPQVVDYKNIGFFKGLNALRFIAAFLVVIHHSETIKTKNNIDSLEWLGLFRNGGNAVTFFFVLSGFLITYLLLKEKKKTNTINVKSFYLKRLYRIWPLYFLLVIIGAILLPYLFKLLNIDYIMPYTIAETWHYFLFFLPGLVTYFFGHHLLEPLWSIGIEEIFYLIWAPIFKFVKKNIIYVLISIILIKQVLILLGIYYIDNDLYDYLIDIFKFEAMAIGGIGAYLLFHHGAHITKSFVFSKYSQIVLFSIISTYLCFHNNVDHIIWDLVFKTPIISDIFIQLLFIYTILCVSIVDSSIVKFRNKTLNFLGEISYGIYMYHMLVIFATIHLLKKYLVQLDSPWSHLLFYVVVTVFTILVSIASKYLFENYFLKFKNKL